MYPLNLGLLNQENGFTQLSVEKKTCGWVAETEQKHGYTGGCGSKESKMARFLFI